MDNSRPLVIAFLVAVVVFAVVVGAVIFRGGDISGDRDQSEDRAGLTGPQTAEAASSRTPAATEEPAAVVLMPPTFDIVRVDAAGTAVIAGRGASDAEVTVLANGEPLMGVEVDSRGEWVAIVSDPLPAGAVELALEMTLDDGQSIRSDQVVVVSIPETRDTRPLVVLGRPGGPSEVLQSPLEDQGLEFALLAIDYDDAGGVIFTGRARPDATVRVIANGAEVGTTQADGIGRWSLVADSTLPPGRYDLQIDQLEDGLVTAVIAVPFERVTPEVLAEAGAQSVIVQPGNSLWRIARRLYGSGWQYTVIYAANEDQIRDPDLIYPGQIFDVPEVEGADRG
ncbi:MAG: LysM peptidoglycan-binding domain-containing protein [Maricaulaceae bacterium]|jgi:nucleoid-associated protein YgaU